MKNDVKKITFTKMHGLGNDYIYVDCFEPQTADIIAQTDLACPQAKSSERFKKVRCFLCIQRPFEDLLIIFQIQCKSVDPQKPFSNTNQA